MIIGLVGKKRSGKDTVAGFLEKEYGFKRFAFADPMKQIIHALDPYVSEFGQRISDGPSSDEQLKVYPEYRRLLQRLGTEAVRDNPLFGENFWVDMLFKAALGVPNVVVSDVRFPNEVTAVLSRGGKIWRITRPGVGNEADLHRSETALDNIMCDVTIVNDGTLSDLMLATHRAFE